MHNTFVKRNSARVTKFVVRSQLLACLLVAFAAIAFGQMPAPELPRVYIDTHWDPPSGGKTWRAHEADEFQRALNQSNPGDAIVLDAGTTYRGSFTVPAKPNPEPQVDLH